jgi:hypothetical protein
LTADGQLVREIESKATFVNFKKMDKKNNVEAKDWLDKHYLDQQNQPLKSGLLI